MQRTFRDFNQYYLTIIFIFLYTRVGAIKWQGDVLMKKNTDGHQKSTRCGEEEAKTKDGKIVESQQTDMQDRFIPWIAPDLIPYAVDITGIPSG